ncbi:MAG: sugar transferase [Bacilli bacterium]|nr:sugar transferase [Bacilli bacterium]MDD4809245.1 sugar transferase [Bacilli bacterium]
MYLKVKRFSDMLLSLIFIIILFPFFIIIMIILKLIGIKNPFYSQKRSAKHNKEFTIYKFRTIDEKKSIPKFCLFLRKKGVDELLQLFNILKGDMSFVGPRPWIVEYSKYFNDTQMKRLDVLPGLTGLAQVSDCKNIFEKIEKDIYYVNNLSFKLDFSIFLRTIKLVLFESKKEFDINNINNEIELLKNQAEKGNGEV